MAGMGVVFGPGTGSEVIVVTEATEAKQYSDSPRIGQHWNLFLINQDIILNIYLLVLIKFSEKDVVKLNLFSMYNLQIIRQLQYFVFNT